MGIETGKETRGGGGGTMEGRRSRGGEGEKEEEQEPERKGTGHATSPAPQAQPAVLAWPRLLPHVDYSRIPPAYCCHICQAWPWIPGTTAVPRRAQLQNENLEVS